MGGGKRIRTKDFLIMACILFSYNAAHMGSGLRISRFFFIVPRINGEETVETQGLDNDNVVDEGYTNI